MHPAALLESYLMELVTRQPSTGKHLIVKGAKVLLVDKKIIIWGGANILRGKKL
jgi:hypothetical protein